LEFDYYLDVLFEYEGKLSFRIVVMFVEMIL